jgi:hypothetical protein
MNRRQNQWTLVGIDGQDSPDRVVGGLQRHVAQQALQAPVALSHALKMLHVPEALGVVVGIVLFKERNVVLHQILSLL